jgi:hypothetical protein
MYSVKTSEKLLIICSKHLPLDDFFCILMGMYLSGFIF